MWIISIIFQVWIYLILPIVFYAGIIFERSGWIVYIFAKCSRWWKRSGKPTIKLVGGGPGDPALLTKAAIIALQEADIVIADRLISKETLGLVRGKIIMSRKYKGCANAAQDELHQWTLEALRQGQHVVRLKGGDPFLYGRGAEEIEIFRHAGFAVEVIPGISSCLAAPLAAGIAVTTRGVSDQLLVATGHGMNDSVPKEVAPYYKGRTTVYLMSVSRMAELIHRLVQAGYPTTTPVAIVERATTIHQRVLRASIQDIEQVCSSNHVMSPATVVVGDAVGHLISGKQNISEYLSGKGSVRFHAPEKDVEY